MAVQYCDGKIVFKGQSYEPVPFHVANQAISVRFDGKGCINQYGILGDKIYYQSNNASVQIYINGKALPFDAPKTVSMIGRIQEITWETESGFVQTKLFLEKSCECVLQRVSIKLHEPESVQIALCMYGVIAGDPVKTKDLEGLEYADCVMQKENAYMITNPSRNFCLASDKEFSLLKENGMVVFETEAAEASFCVVYGYDVTDIDRYVSLCGSLEAQAESEIQNVHLPDSAVTELDQALYYSAYFCALQNYKEKGLFKGFAAGAGYLTPVRTYYRDSYFTVLPMYNGHADKIRNQIITLGMGISEDGECPSAVISDFSPWWGNHYDSPSLYAILLYDYVINTGDFSVLDQLVGDRTVLEKAEAVVIKLAGNCDQTGLVVKQGQWNTRDWADIVNRYGYVTYIEVLYARALYCLSMLFKEKDVKKSEAYMKAYHKVKKAINSTLWDDSLGHYVNFKNNDHTESNLSIDTILAVVYGVAEGDRAKRMLRSCQQMLESRNHPELIDFGILSVYPLYGSIYEAYGRSSRPYDYHNGACWPYWAGMYAYALKMYGMDYTYALTRWFAYNIEQKNFTPIEYYSPYCKDGALLQAWSSTSAFVYYDKDCTFFTNKI